MNQKALRAVFILGLAISAVAAIVVATDGPDPVDWTAPETPRSARQFQVAIDAAMSDYDANNLRTDSAPQQQVVNGWVARDLLRIAALQLDAQLEALEALTATVAATAVQPTPTDDRTPRLLAILTIVFVWSAMWAVTEVSRRSAPRTIAVSAPPARLDAPVGPPDPPTDADHHPEITPPR